MDTKLFISTLSVTTHQLSFRVSHSYLPQI